MGGEPVAQHRREAEPDQADHHKRRGLHQERDAPPPPAAVPVGPVADDRHQEDIRKTRKRNHHHRVNEVGYPEGLHHQPRDIPDRPLFQTPREIAPEQPDEEQDDAGCRVGKRSRPPDFLFFCFCHEIPPEMSSLYFRLKILASERKERRKGNEEKCNKK